MGSSALRRLVPHAYVAPHVLVAFIVFAVLHLYVVLFDSHQYRNGLISSIVSGYKFYEEGDLDHDSWLS